MARHVRKGDQVVVLSGRYKGQKGTIIEVLNDKERVRIEGVGKVKRHLSPNKDQKHPQGGIIEKLATFHWSSVAAVDPKSGKATRVGFKLLDDGRKVRVAKKSGEIIADAS